MEGFYVLITPDLINSMKDFFAYQILFDEKKCYQLAQSNDIQLDVPSPAKSISQYIDLNRKKSSATETPTDDQRILYLFIIK
jgi:hypothetical protein